MRAALILLATLSTPTVAMADRVRPQNPPESLYMEAWRRAEALPASDALCRHRMPKRLMRALHERCLWLTAGTASNCGVDAGCGKTLEELRAWCPVVEPGAVPCSQAAYPGVNF